MASVEDDGIAKVVLEIGKGDGFELENAGIVMTGGRQLKEGIIWDV